MPEGIPSTCSPGSEIPRASAFAMDSGAEESAAAPRLPMAEVFRNCLLDSAIRDISSGNCISEASSFVLGLEGGYFSFLKKDTFYCIMS